MAGHKNNHMNILTANQVKRKISEEPTTHLIMVLNESAFKKAHIPGSLNISNIDDALKLLSINEPIIVYCSDNACIASYMAYQQLDQAGYKHIWRFAGGLREWTEHGYEVTSGPS